MQVMHVVHVVLIMHVIDYIDLKVNKEYKDNVLDIEQMHTLYSK